MRSEVLEWSMHVNISLLVIYTVDAWLLYDNWQVCRGCMSPKEFYSTLVEQHIGNKHWTTFTGSQYIAADEASSVTPNGIGPHLTLTNCKWKRPDVSMNSCSYQVHCTVCKEYVKPKHVCSNCTCDTSSYVWICYCFTGRFYFRKHLCTFSCRRVLVACFP